MKITALFCCAPNMGHSFKYTKLKDNDSVCGGA